MDERPQLNPKLDEKTFRSYYYLKEELMAFCRENGLSASGGKLEITERIAHYLRTGEVLSFKGNARTRTIPDVITEDTLIEANFVCSEKHRAFFREKIGKTFTFPVAFQKWLKTNTGKTYREAVEAYFQLLEEKKHGTTQIGKQFEYNTYIRDFFQDNPDKSLEDAIRCWTYKKQRPGHNRYEPSDLEALTGA